MDVFTSITLNYLPKARVLASSLKKFHPDWMFYVVISDKLDPRYNWKETINLDEEPFDEIIWAEELGIADFDSWLFKHSVVEISTAVKGPTFQKFAEEKPGKLLYLDPDIAVFNDLSFLEEKLDDSAILLTPHLLSPQIDRRAILDNEINSALLHGVFNLGFLAVNSEKSEGYNFSHWWADRLIHYCYDDKENGLFTDQKWCDLVPCFFDDYYVIRDPGYNVASWNLSLRNIKINDSGTIFINDKYPLKFYHFTGFDSGAGHLMTQVYSQGNIVVDEIWAWYRRQLTAFQQEEAFSMKWFYDYYTDGEKIPREARILYRRRYDLETAFPHPFDAQTGDGGYQAWYRREVLAAPYK